MEKYITDERTELKYELCEQIYITKRNEPGTIPSPFTKHIHYHIITV